MITVDCGTFVAVGKTAPVEGRVLLEVDYEKQGLLVLELIEGRKQAALALGAAEYSAFSQRVASIKLDIRKLPAAQVAALPEWLDIVSYSSHTDCILTGGGKGRGGGVLASLEVDATMRAYVRLCAMDGSTEVSTIMGSEGWEEFTECWRCLKAHISKLTAGGNFHGFNPLTLGAV